MAFSTKLTVCAGNHARRSCPVEVFLPLAAADLSPMVLNTPGSRQAVPCQVTPVKGGIRLAWIVDALPPGECRTYTAKTVKAPVKDRVVLAHDRDSSTVNILVDDKLFTTYHYGRQWVRPFLHPLLGPGGIPMTRTWPISGEVPGETNDHPHHKSLWVAHGECGRVDNWSEEPGHGFQRHIKFNTLVSGPVFGKMTARIDWCHPSGRKQFEERRTIRSYALPRGIRLMDVEVAFRMSEGPVVFRDTKEGGLLSVRVATAMDGDKGGRIENAYGGVSEKETWGKKSPWCDYSGVVEGKQVGIAVFDHEDNPRYPTEWHVRDYGLMTANCFARSYYAPEKKERGDMAFRKGQRTTWCYRVYLHAGDARRGKVAERFRDFIAPPEVTVG